MNERELLERLAVFFFKRHASEALIENLSEKKMWEWSDLAEDLLEYLPAQPSSDAPVQMEVRPMTDDDAWHALTGE